MKHFTQNDLIRFIYKETSASETLSIGEALIENDKLYDDYELLLNASQQLPKVKFNPSPSSIQTILEYSQQRTLEALY